MTERLERLVAGERREVARTLNALERQGRPSTDPKLRALVDAAALVRREGAKVIGLTGPPGVGKSTLASRLIERWRREELSVGAIAVDPTSRCSGGALLGDRARMGRHGSDPGVFIRSMAARDRLGGLAPAAELAVYVMRAAWDRVIVETVGVGQSETDVTDSVDATVVVVQPGSGDTLQFIKSGVMDIPDVLVVNKADMGEVARRSVRDLTSALQARGRPETPVLSVSALQATTLQPLFDAISRLRSGSVVHRNTQIGAHAARMFAGEHGRRAVRMLGGDYAVQALVESLDGGPLSRLSKLEAMLASRMP